MNQDDLKNYVSLAQYLLTVSELQIASTKAFLARFEALESSQNLRAQMTLLPESDKLRELRKQLDDADRKAAAGIAATMPQLRDVLASTETGHEHMQAYLKALRASLPPSPGHADT
jgi:hypothetical protein